MFDHPGNLRFPTHWHARTYGLLTANRFGTDHFAMSEGSHLGVICRPNGTKCPACNSRGGDYNIAAGENLTLRHRFYIRHGDTKSANVAGQYRAYTADPESTLAHMHALRQRTFQLRTVSLLVLHPPVSATHGQQGWCHRWHVQ
jgi:hypothetical protein